MKRRGVNITAKSILSKYGFILLLVMFVPVFSCAPVQYGFDARANSKFSTFDGLGIAKEEFIKQYGPPTNKGMYQRTPAIKIEKLYYTEKIKSFLVTTEFIFEDNVLKKMERVETRNNFQEVKEQLETID